MKTITHNGTTYHCPFADALPPLKPEERAALVEDIKARGVVVAVTLDRVGGDEVIIDGHNRLEIAAELGLTYIPISYVNRELNNDKRRALAEDLNLHRRHLTPEQQQEVRRRRVERVAEKRRQGKSTRQIAEEEKVSVGQVQRDLSEATVSGDTVDPPGGKVTGKDGRVRSARRPPRVVEQPRQEAEQPREATDPSQGQLQLFQPEPEPQGERDGAPARKLKNWPYLKNHGEDLIRLGKEFAKLSRVKTTERKVELVTDLCSKARKLIDYIEKSTAE